MNGRETDYLLALFSRQAGLAKLPQPSIDGRGEGSRTLTQGFGDLAAALASHPYCNNADGESRTPNDSEECLVYSQGGLPMPNVRKAKFNCQTSRG